jgi:S-adenosylhomocysteine hydrolase
MEPSVVVDDGGLVAPVLATLVPELVPAYRGLVEQSMAGVAELEELQATGTALPLPVFSVAQSKVKRGIEAHWIAESVLRALRDLLPADAFDGTPALVLGFGAVGEQVAAVLRGQRMRVAVHDTDWPRLLAAHEAGYLTAPEIPALLDGHRPLLIVASTGRTARTGRPALAGEDLDFLAGECFVASVSGRGAEIDLSALASRADRIEDLGRAGMRYVLPAGPITVLPDGLPLNTPRGEPATSTPTRQSDLTMAAAAWGACTLARPGHAFGPGPDVTATDASIAESGLLERYYQLYGPGSGGDARSTRARPRGVRRRARISEA